MEVSLPLVKSILVQIVEEKSEKEHGVPLECHGRNPQANACSSGAWQGPPPSQYFLTHLAPAAEALSLLPR